MYERFGSGSTGFGVPHEIQSKGSWDSVLGRLDGGGDPLVSWLTHGDELVLAVVRDARFLSMWAFHGAT